MRARFFGCMVEAAAAGSSLPQSLSAEESGLACCSSFVVEGFFLEQNIKVS